MRGAGVPGAAGGTGLVIVSLSDGFSCAPQVPQNRCASGFGALHDGQRVSGMRGRGDYSGADELHIARAEAAKTKPTSIHRTADQS